MSWDEHASTLLDGYYDKTGLPRGGDAIMVSQRLYPCSGVITVRIRVDGYQVEFSHNDDYEIPPPTSWVKM